MSEPTPFTDPAPRGSPPYWLREREIEHEAMHVRLLESAQQRQGVRALPKVETCGSAL